MAQPQSKEEKLAALGKVMIGLNARKAKKNPNDDRPAVYFAGQRPDLLDHGVLKTGNLALDEVLHGGIKRGGLTTLYGPPSCGKTSLCLEAIAFIQAQGGVCAYLHSEALFPLEHARMLGVDLDQLIMIQDFNAGEDAFNILNELLVDEHGVPRNAIDLVVVDSIAALVPKYQLDKMTEEGMEAQEMGSHPKMLTNETRRLFGTGALGKASVIFINQVRDNLSGYGGGFTMPGGHAVKHFSHVIIRVTAPKAGILTEGTGVNKRVVGHTVHLAIEKNKAGLGGHPGEDTDYEVRYNVGLDNILPLFNAACVAGIIGEPSKSYFIFDLPKSVLSPLGLWKEQRNSKDEIVADEPLKIHGQDAVTTAIRTSDDLQEILYGVIRDGLSVDEVLAKVEPKEEQAA